MWLRVQKRMLREFRNVEKINGGYSYYQCFDVENGIHFYEGTAVGLIHSDDIAPSVLLKYYIHLTNSSNPIKPPPPQKKKQKQKKPH